MGFEYAFMMTMDKKSGWTYISSKFTSKFIIHLY